MINQTAPDTTDELEDMLGQKELEKIKSKSISGALSFFLRTLIIQGIGLVSALILSAYFSPADFGVYALITQLIGILIFFSDVGLAAALIQRKEEPSLEHYRTAFTAQQVLSWLIVASIMLIISTGLIQAKTGSAGVWILISLGLSFPLATMQTISRIKLERELRFNKLVLPQLLEQIVFHGILIWLAIRGSGAIAYAYAIIARAIVGSITMFVLAPWPVGLSLNKREFDELFHYGIKFQINDFLARIKDQFFFSALAFWFPINQFGYINWAKNWSIYPYNLTVQNVMAITFPTFSRLQGNKDALKRAIEKSLYFISLFIFPVLVGMTIFVYPLVSIEPRYAKWQPALLSLVMFSLSIAWGAISTPLTNTLNAIGHINTTLKLMVMWTVLTWVVTPLMIWQFGFNGVAIAAFVISFSSIMSIYYVKKIIPIDVWQQVWQQLVSAGVMAVVAILGMPWWSTGYAFLGAGMIIAGAAYVATMLLVGRERLTIELASLRKKSG